MNFYPALLIAGTVALAIAAIMVARVRSQHDAREIEGALEVLRTLRWKEFAQFVTQAFTSRGFKMAASQRTAGEGGVDFVMERGGTKHLLQIKHGGSYLVGAGPVRTLAGMLDSREAKAGILVTSGRFDQSAQEAARGQPVTLIDGDALWKELRPLISGAMREEAQRRAAEHAREANKKGAVVGVVGLVLLLAGGALFYLDWRAGGRGATTTDDVAATTPPDAAAPAVEPTPAPAPAPAPAPVAPVETPPPADATAPPTPPPAEPGTAFKRPAGPMRELTDAELQTQRDLAAAEALLVDGVASATWPSRSTMLVTLRQKDPPNRAEILAGVCQKITAREALRFTRLQVTTFGVDPNGPGNVRWFQCR